MTFTQFEYALLVVLAAILFFLVRLARRDPNLTHAPVIDASGVDPSVIARLSEIVGANQKSFEADVLASAQIARLDLRPGDILVARFKGRLSGQQVERVRLSFKDIIGDHKIMVLEDGANLSVLTAAQIEARIGRANSDKDFAKNVTDVLVKHRANNPGAPL